MPGETNEQALTPAAAGPMLLHIAERVLNRPLLLHPAKAEIILHVLEGRLPLDGALAPLSPEANRFLGSSTRPDGRERKYRVRDGTAVIPVVGSLVNRGGWIGANSGMTSYEGLSAQLRDAEADADVSSILLDIDSPGGEATGMFAVAEQVRLVGRTKPVTAFVNDMAASAAYGIASAASEIVVSPTSVTGSIGVVMTHMDRSRQLERSGVKPTLIYAGRHKADGNPFGPLSEDVQADLQAEVCKFYDQFVNLVDRGRPGMTGQSIRDTEARTYIGQDAIDRGLADRMASLDEVLNDLSSTARGARNRSWFGMTKTTEAAAPQADIAGLSPEAHAAAVAAARAAAFAEGAAAERTRVGAILRSDASEGRERQAAALALDTDLTAGQAIKVLGVSPRDAGGRPAVPAIAERAAAEHEFGSTIPLETASQRTRSGWARAVESANRSIGVKR
jgi:signal peptide peptidase SppA